MSGDALNSKLVSDREHENGAAASLRKSIEGFPVNCVKAEVAVDPAATHRDDGKTTVYLTVRLSVDEEKFAVFRHRFENALRQVAKETWDEVWNLEAESGTRQAEPVYDISRHDSEDWAKHKRRTEKGLLVVALNTHRSEAWNRLNWDVYVLDGTLRSAFSRDRSFECRLSAIWQDEGVDLLDLFLPSAEMNLTGGTDSGDVYFCPAFFGSGGISPRVTIAREIAMSANELKRLQGVKCEVRMCSDPNDFEKTKTDFMELAHEIEKMKAGPNATPDDVTVLWMRKTKLSEAMLHAAERNPKARENLRESFDRLQQMMQRTQEWRVSSRASYPPHAAQCIALMGWVYRWLGITRACVKEPPPKPSLPGIPTAWTSKPSMTGPRGKPGRRLGQVPVLPPRRTTSTTLGDHTSGSRKHLRKLPPSSPCGEWRKPRPMACGATPPPCASMPTT